MTPGYLSDEVVETASVSGETLSLIFKSGKKVSITCIGESVGLYSDWPSLEGQKMNYLRVDGMKGRARCVISVKGSYGVLVSDDIRVSEEESK